MTSRLFPHQLCQVGGSRLQRLSAHMTRMVFQQLLCCLSGFQAQFLYILIALINYRFFSPVPQGRQICSHYYTSHGGFWYRDSLLLCLCLFCSSLCVLFIICCADAVQSVLGCSSEGATLKIVTDLVCIVEYESSGSSYVAILDQNWIISCFSISCGSWENNHTVLSFLMYKIQIIFPTSWSCCEKNICKSLNKIPTHGNCLINVKYYYLISLFFLLF